MHGSWFWLTMSELMYVPACQGMALILFGITPNLRLSLSLSALLGIICFSIAAFSFPEQSMYPGISIFSWLLPSRYNFLIYIDQALNGRDSFSSAAGGMWLILSICCFRFFLSDVSRMRLCARFMFLKIL